MKKFGFKLRALRELHNYKQEYIGDFLGIGQSAYSRIENGKPDNISLGQISKLAYFYKVTPEQLLGWDGKINLVLANGEGVSQSNHNITITTEERIKYLEEKLEHLMSLVKNNTV